MSSSKDSTRISSILNEIKRSEQESIQFRSGNPRMGIPIPQPLISNQDTGLMMNEIRESEKPVQIIKKKGFVHHFRVYLKQGILFFFLFFLCGNSSFRSGFLDLFSGFAVGNQISTMGQIVLSLMATIGFILLQIVF